MTLLSAAAAERQGQFSLSIVTSGPVLPPPRGVEGWRCLLYLAHTTIWLTRGRARPLMLMSSGQSAVPLPVHRVSSTVLLRKVAEPAFLSAACGEVQGQLSHRSQVVG